ncbi:MAG TPA: transglutaminase domain-containing protein [Dehalococcoidia bacterium]|nr:transglutaminase domain-containing protein [Dehalococcoidia bacterium]
MTTEQNKLGQHLFLSLTGSLAAGLSVWWIQSRLNKGTYALDELFSPQNVADIAATLPQDEDEFILAAWDLVGRKIRYKSYGSTVQFYDSTVYCQRCLLPEQVLKKGAANCVGKSNLLVSLLRNRLPEDRVSMAIGQLAVDHVGGHAWVIVQRQNGVWYVLEATMPPPSCNRNPWIPMALVSSTYIPDAFVNDIHLTCMDEEICLDVKKVSCPCRLRELGRFS